MAFKFRLEKVLTLRKEAVEKAQLAHIAAKQALVEAKKALEANIQEIKQRNEDLIRNNYNMAQDHLRVIKALHDQQKQLKENVFNAEIEIKKAKQALVDAQMKLEALQKLKEKKQEEYELEARLLDQKQTDERATLKFTSKLMQENQENEE
jgi:flagellar FliJ protein